MTVLVANAVLILLYSVVFRSNKKIVVGLGALQIFMVLALRADTYGTDAVYYMNGYALVSTFSWNDLLESLSTNPFSTAHLVWPYSFENGWVVLNWVVSRLGLDYHLFVIITSAITAICFGRFSYRYSESPGLTLFVISCMNFLLYSFFILRQTMALCICLEAIPFILKRKPLPFCLTVFFACCFHRSAILFAVLYPLAGLELKRNTFPKAVGVFFIVLLLSMFVFPAALPAVLSFFWKAHLELNFEWNNLILLQLLIVVGCCFFDTAKIGSESRKNNLLLWALLASLISYAPMLNNEVLARSNEYLWIFVAPLIPLMINRIQGHARVLVTMLLVVLLMGFLVYQVEGSVFDPYVSCLS